MHNRLNNKRINGVALEMIMRDVLDGMFEFTHRASAGGETDTMEIIAVQKADNSTPDKPSADVIPFPARTSSR